MEVDQVRRTLAVVVAAVVLTVEPSLDPAVVDDAHTSHRTARCSGGTRLDAAADLAHLLHVYASLLFTKFR